MQSKVSQEIIDEDEPTAAEKNLEKVIMKSEQIQEKMSSRGPLSRFIDDGKVLISLVKDYRAGQYRRIPYGTIAAVVFTLLYVFNPLDLLPDVLPFIGVLDDATVVGACLFAIERDLSAYKNWKQAEGFES